jgi:hypothetical protein
MKIISRKHTMIILEVIMIIVVLLATNLVTADTSDTFNITVSGEYLECNIIEDSWAIGVVAMSSSSWTNETGDTLNADIDNSTVDVNFQLQITTDATTWSSSGTGASPGADIYRLNASANSWSTQIQVITASFTTLVASTQTDQTFDLRFDTPTSTTTGQQQSITVTGSVIKA